MKYYVDYHRPERAGDCVGAPEPIRTEWPDYQAAIEHVRARTRKPKERGSFVIVEGVKICLRVWRDGDHWRDAGKYA